MSFNGLQEILETLDEISAFLSNLDSRLTDKKTVSDVMLALEKVTSVISGKLSPEVSAISSALSLLFEKFLMESVADGAPGLERTRRGVELIRAALTGEGDAGAISEEAGKIAAEVSHIYGVAVEGVTPAAPEAPPQEPAAEETQEDDEFFAALESVPKTPAEEVADVLENASASDPVRDKLSDISGEVTMLDTDMLDKKAVSDIMLWFENLVASMEERHFPAEVIRLGAALGGIYEKSLIEGLEDGQKGLDLTTEGIKVITACLDNIDEPEKIVEWAEEVISSIETDLNVTAPAISASAGAEEAPEEEAAPEAAAGASELGGVASEGSYVIHVASADDLLIYNEFVSEAADTVHSLETELLNLEASPGDLGLINHIFREFHSLKGAAGFLGLNTINILCHEAETLLDKLRKHELSCNHSMIDTFLKSLDVIRMVIDELHSSCEQAHGEIPNAELRLPRYNIDALVKQLESLGKKKGAVAKPTLDEDVEKLGDILKGKHLITDEQLEQALKKQEREPLGKILVDMGAVDSTSVGAALRYQEEKKRKVRVSSIKVDTEKLDSLLELVGELVISQSIVIQDTVLSEEINRNLHKNITNLGKITKNIQDHVMSLRMVPLKQTFQKMNRLVRDLSKKMNKPVVFHVSGEDTEIDKTIIEELNDPLVHLLRNSMDHGVETPEARHASGKDMTGNVWLSARHSGGNVLIDITDDGKGLDREKILRKATEKGLIQPGAELTDNEIYGLIFAPGFSTHDVATDISGRGVGMDVVYSNIDSLGGRVELASKPGEGATITIKLPLTMAIVDGMIVKIGAERFIIPTTSIRESIRPKKDEISTVRREGEVINIRGRLLPLVRLGELLNVKNPAAMNPWEGLVIIVESEEKEYGFMVDDLLGQQQVVIKSLGKRFKGLPGISGGTILGDGCVGLILDVSGIVGMC